MASARLQDHAQLNVYKARSVIDDQQETLQQDQFLDAAKGLLTLSVSAYATSANAQETLPLFA